MGQNRQTDRSRVLKRNPSKVPKRSVQSKQRLNQTFRWQAHWWPRSSLQALRAGAGRPAANDSEVQAPHDRGGPQHHRLSRAKTNKYWLDQLEGLYRTDVACWAPYWELPSFQAFCQSVLQRRCRLHAPSPTRFPRLHEHRRWKVPNVGDLGWLHRQGTPQRSEQGCSIRDWRDDRELSGALLIHYW